MVTGNVAATVNNSNARVTPWFSVQWHITARCDQRCRHCYLWNSPDVYQRELSRELPLKDCYCLIDSVLELCTLAGARPIFYITGGDPLLHPGFFKILKYLSSANVPSKIMGNPHHLTSSNIAKMHELGVLSYQLSLDGLIETHDWFRGNGSYHRTILGINLLNENEMPVVVMFTLSPKNISELIPVFDLCCENGVNKFAFARYSPECDVDNDLTADAQILPTEYRNLLDSIYKRYLNAKKRGYRTVLSKKDNLWKLYFLEEGLLSLPENPNDKIQSGCHVGRANLTILSDGTVYACRRYKSPIGHIPKQTALEVFTSDSLNEYRDKFKHVKCSTCDLLNHCRGCPAVAFYATGSFFGADPQCWK